jgi:hypothetical protein
MISTVEMATLMEDVSMILWPLQIMMGSMTPQGVMISIVEMATLVEDVLISWWSLQMMSGDDVVL